MDIGACCVTKVICTARYKENKAPMSKGSCPFARSNSRHKVIISSCVFDPQRQRHWCWWFWLGVPHFYNLDALSCSRGNGPLALDESAAYLETSGNCGEST